jgi:hypothetical protein
MRKLLIAIILACSPALAQFTSTASHIRPVASLPAHCSATGGDVVFLRTNATVYTCTATDTWTTVGGAATARTLLGGATAGAYVGVPGPAGVIPAAGGCTPTLEADGIGTYLACTNNSGNGQLFYQRGILPQDWTGVLKINIEAWSTSTSAATLNVAVACIASGGVTTGLSYQATAPITFTPLGSSADTYLAAQSLTTTGCAAGRSITVRYTVVGSAAAALNVRSLQVTE